MNKLLTKIVGAALGVAMTVGVGVAVASQNNSSVQRAEAAGTVAATGDMTSTFSGTGGTASCSSVSQKSGYYQDNGTKNSSVCTFQILNNSAWWTTTPTSISFSANLAGGTAKNPLDHPIQVQLLGSGGSNLGSAVTVTTSVTTSSTAYEVSIPVQNNVYGVKMTHVKEDSWNARYYSFTLSYVASGGVTTYSITYDKNTTDTVTGMPSQETGLEPGAHTLSDATPTRAGYSFGGWAATSDSSTPITSVTITNQDKTVYAIWSEATVSGTFNKFTGVLADGDYILTYGSVAMGNTVASSKIQNSNLSFSSGAASITNPVASAVYTIESVDEDGETYWTLKNGALNKYVQGSTSTNMTLSSGGDGDANKYKVSVSNGTYNFLCKATENENTKRYIRSYNNVWGSYASSNGGPLTLYKKYVAYVVSYDNNGGSGTMANSETTVSACTFTAPDGKEFDHWNTASDNSGTSYNAGDSVTASCTLYAIWRDLVPSASINKNTVNLAIDGTTSDTVTATTTNIKNATFVWARLSGDDCVTLTNDSTATVTISIKTGVAVFSSCVVRVTINGTLGGNAITPITKDVTVKISRTSTTDNPFTVAEAKTAIDELSTISDAYVTGIVSQVDSYNSTYNSITYWISDDGTTTNQMEVYSGLGIGGAAFSSKDDVEVGATVKVKGNLKLYNTVYEFDKNNQLVTYVAPVKVLSKIEISDEITAYEVGDDFVKPTVTATYEDDSTKDVTANATFTGYDMSVAGTYTVTVSYSENGTTKTAEYEITVSPVTVKYTVSFAAGEGTGSMDSVQVSENTVYNLPSCSFTAPAGKRFAGWSVGGNIVTSITVTGNVTVTATWELIPTANYKKVKTNLANFSGDYLIVYEGDQTHDPYAFNGALENVDTAKAGASITISNEVISLSEEYEFTVASKTGGYSIQSASGTYIGKEANANGMDQSDTNDYTNNFSYESSDESMDIIAEGGTTLRYNYNSDQLRFRFYKSGQQSVSIYMQVDDAQALALDILNLTFDTCDGYVDGTTTHTKSDFEDAWDDLEAEYALLDSSEKAELASFVANDKGTMTQEAMARYELLVRKYGLTAFIEDHVVSGSRVNQINNSNNESSAPAIIAIVSVVSLTAVGGFFLLRKRKEQ